MSRVGRLNPLCALRSAHRTYTIEGDYRVAQGRDSNRVRFEDKIEATSAMRAFMLWERKHCKKSLLRVRAITPLW